MDTEPEKTGTREDLPWHSLGPSEALRRLEAQADRGLSEEAAGERLARFGPNRLQSEKPEPFWKELLEELAEPMILLLLGTGALYAAWGELGDALTIFFVILATLGVEMYNESRAKRAMKALERLAEPATAVWRAGRYREIPVEELVPGDIILLQAGRRVAADARLLESYSLALEEAALTGEALPVEKEAGATLPEQTPLAERRNLVFAGTNVIRGRGRAVVVATGTATELGRVAGLARGVKPPRTPLQLAMRELTGGLVWLALGFSLLVPLLGRLISRQPLEQMVLTGLSLAFATIPEEMPILITMALALGAYRLSGRKAIVKRLRAVETLGALTVIATDKTGTLTGNHMRVSRIFPENRRREILKTGALCNEAVESGPDFAGDPLETALLRAARAEGFSLSELRQGDRLLQEFSFDNTRKRMSAVYERAGNRWIGLKGAPEAVLACCTADQGDSGEAPLDEAGRQAILDEAAKMAAQGLRVIAFAQGERAGKAGALSQAGAEADLCFTGLAGLEDPVRPEAFEAIRACREAGIRPLMITGDHPLTAGVVARQAGLDDSGRVLTGPELDALDESGLQKTLEEISVFARATPEHKLRIVQALLKKGERVAVTGDGINDAPALAAADIGIAMGETGTDAAREAAGIVLADDNFATLTGAVEEGRRLFANLRKAVRYYLACKAALVSITLLPALLGLPVPFAPVQIILMELFMDLAAAATFIIEPAEADLLRQPPRDPRARFLDRNMVGGIFAGGAGLFAAVTTAYLVSWYAGSGLATAQTAAFTTWLLGHALLALNMRSEREPLFRLGLFSNRLMLLWGAAVVIFLLAADRLPGVQTALKTTGLEPAGWALVLVAALTGTFWLEAWKWYRYRQNL